MLSQRYIGELRSPWIGLEHVIKLPTTIICADSRIDKQFQGEEKLFFSRSPPSTKFMKQNVSLYLGQQIKQTEQKSAFLITSYDATFAVGLGIVILT